jgi:hypothetical protein
MSYLMPECEAGKAGLCQGKCPTPVKESLGGKWYITMGHAGFNSPSNNGSGYASKAKALAAWRRYSNKGGK